MAINDLFFSDAFAAANDRFQGMGSSIMDLFYIQDSILKPDAQTLLKKLTGLLDELYDSATDIAPDYDLNLTGYKAILRQGHQAYSSYVDPYVQNIIDSLKQENGKTSLFVKGSIATSIMVYSTYGAYNNLYNNIDKMSKSEAIKAIAGCLIMSASSAILAASIFEPSIEVSVYSLSAMFMAGGYLWKKGMGPNVDTDLLNNIKACICEVISAFTPNRVLPASFENFMDNLFAPEVATSPAQAAQESTKRSEQDAPASNNQEQTIQTEIQELRDNLTAAQEEINKIKDGANKEKRKAKGPEANFADTILGNIAGTSRAKKPRSSPKHR